MTVVVIMVGGLGKEDSELPKVLHDVGFTYAC